MDYYHHYQCFVKELRANPDLKLQAYCGETDIVWRRLYDWMRRNHISLKQLYKTYGRNKSDTGEIFVKEEQPIFSELKVIPDNAPKEMFAAVERVRLTFPSGTTVDMSSCPASVLSMLVSQCIGKEAADVRS